MFVSREYSVKGKASSKATVTASPKPHTDYRSCRPQAFGGVAKRVDIVLTGQAILALYIHSISHSPMCGECEAQALKPIALQRTMRSQTLVFGVSPAS
jgi:hypothetical protein